MATSRKTDAKVQTFENEEQVAGNNVVTTYGQPIENKFTDGQVCIYEWIVQ